MEKKLTGLFIQILLARLKYSYCIFSIAIVRK